MYAIIKTGGKQYKVEEGETVDVEKLDAEAGDAVEFEEIKAVSTEDGLEVGAPNVEGATVTGEVVKNDKGEKIIVYKYKPKENYRIKQGHRQPYTRVKINSVEV